MSMWYRKEALCHVKVDLATVNLYRNFKCASFYLIVKCPGCMCSPTMGYDIQHLVLNLTPSIFPKPPSHLFICV